MKYYLFVTGCQQNIYDSERIAHLLKKMGYVLAPEKKADLIVVLSCSVRQKPIDRIWGKLRLWHRRSPRPKIIVTGCLLAEDKIKMEPKIDAFVPVEKIKKELPKILRRSLKQCSHETMKQFNRNGYVPIMYGCDNFCSYCAVPYTRGREQSRPMDKILAEMKNLAKNGIKEITLLGQNVNSYGRGPTRIVTRTNADDISVNQRRNQRKTAFVLLLEQIEKIEELKKISFLTSHPKDMSEDLIEWMAKSKKFSRELHLPLQSGDDGILRRMNRGYTANDYLDLVNKIRKKISAQGGSAVGGKNLRLTTDIIVGFPNETKKQFENTVKLVKKIGFRKAYIACYSPRPGTVAARIKDNVLMEEKKKRWKILNLLVNKKSRLP